MTAYVEELRRSEKRVNLIEGSLQIGRLLPSNDQAHRRGLTSFLDLASSVVLLGIFHVFFLTIPVFLLPLIRFRRERSPFLVYDLTAIDSRIRPRDASHRSVRAGVKACHEHTPDERGPDCAPEP